MSMRIMRTVWTALCVETTIGTIIWHVINAACASTAWMNITVRAAVPARKMSLSAAAATSPALVVQLTSVISAGIAVKSAPCSVRAAVSAPPALINSAPTAAPALIALRNSASPAAAVQIVLRSARTVRRCVRRVAKRNTYPSTAVFVSIALRNSAAPAAPVPIVFISARTATSPARIAHPCSARNAINAARAPQAPAPPAIHCATTVLMVSANPA